LENNKLLGVVTIALAWFVIGIENVLSVDLAKTCLDQWKLTFFIFFVSRILLFTLLILTIVQQRFKRVDQTCDIWSLCWSFEDVAWTRINMKDGKTKNCLFDWSCQSFKDLFIALIEVEITCLKI
jgi:hypothetical protein